MGKGSGSGGKKEPRICPQRECGGQGGWWVSRNGKPERWVKCTRCNGTGRV